jgi:hypothetical protein
VPSKPSTRRAPRIDERSEPAEVSVTRASWRQAEQPPG